MRGYIEKIASEEKVDVHYDANSVAELDGQVRESVMKKIVKVLFSDAQLRLSGKNDVNNFAGYGVFLNVLSFECLFAR